MQYKLDLWSKYGFDLKRLLLPQLPLDRHLKPEKCFLAGSELLYLRYVVSREGISADVQKVEAVRSFPKPND